MGGIELEKIIHREEEHFGILSHFHLLSLRVLSCLTLRKVVTIEKRRSALEKTYDEKSKIL